MHEAVKLMAKKEGISINQLISSAVAEKIAAQQTEHYLMQRAKQGNEARFLEAMSKLPDIEADEKDRF